MRPRTVAVLALGWSVVGIAMMSATSIAAEAPKPVPASVATPPAVAGSRASEYVGQEVTIEGRVTAVHESPLATVLAFAQNFAGFTATILAADRDKFPPDLGGRIRDKVVRVTGTVTAYRGKPEMALRDPSQLVLSAPSPGTIGAPVLPPAAPAVVAPADTVTDEVRRALARIESRLEDLEGRMRELEEEAATPGDVAESRPRPLTLGAGAADVRSLLGEPLAIDRGANGESLWGYGRDRSVTFDASGRVTAWTGF